MPCKFISFFWNHLLFSLLSKARNSSLAWVLWQCKRSYSVCGLGSFFCFMPPPRYSWNFSSVSLVFPMSCFVLLKHFINKIHWVLPLFANTFIVRPGWWGTMNFLQRLIIFCWQHSIINPPAWKEFWSLKLVRVTSMHVLPSWCIVEDNFSFLFNHRKVYKFAFPEIGSLYTTHLRCFL